MSFPPQSHRTAPVSPGLVGHREPPRTAAATRPRRLAGPGVILILGFILLLLAPLHAASPSIEYRIKAVALLNVAKFTQWPTRALPRPGSPFVFGIKGDDPFGNSLTEALQGETISGHPVTAQLLKPEDEGHNCHLLFIGRSEAAKLGEILKSLEGKPILTVSDVEEFTGHGGMIQFVLQEDRVRFDINASAATNSDLKLSSKLLSVARRITDK